MAATPRASADIRDAAERIRKLARDAHLKRPDGKQKLAYYVALGNVIRSLDHGYGRQAIKLLAATLNETGLGDNNLHKAVRFAQAVADGRLDATELDKKQVSWRVASRLTTDNLTDTKLEQVLGQVQAGTVAPADLGRILDSKLSPAATLTTRSVLAAGDRAREAIEQLQKAKSRGQDMAVDILDELRQLLDRE